MVWDGALLGVTGNIESNLTRNISSMNLAAARQCNGINNRSLQLFASSGHVDSEYAYLKKLPLRSIRL